MQLLSGARRSAASCLVNGLITLGLAALPALSAPFTASGTISQFFPDAGNPGVGNGTSGPSGATWDHSFDSGNGLYAANSAFAGDGIIRALAAVSLDWPGWASGSISATANASIVETLLFDWMAAAAHANDPNLTAIRMSFDIGITGIVLASSDSGPVSGASVSYSANVGDAYAEGSRLFTAGGAVQESGAWGNVTFTTTIPYNSNVNLNLAASASASAGKTYLSFPIADALGDFSNTMRWGGVTRIIAINSLGQERDLTGVYIPIIGRDSGFDYFYAAPADPGSDVPEPSTFLLLGSGLAVVLWKRKQFTARTR